MSLFAADQCISSIHPYILFRECGNGLVSYLSVENINSDYSRTSLTCCFVTSCRHRSNMAVFVINENMKDLYIYCVCRDKQMRLSLSGPFTSTSTNSISLRWGVGHRAGTLATWTQHNSLLTVTWWGANTETAPGCLSSLCPLPLEAWWWCEQASLHLLLAAWYPHSHTPPPPRRPRWAANAR